MSSFAFMHSYECGVIFFLSCRWKNGVIVDFIVCNVCYPLLHNRYVIYNLNVYVLMHTCGISRIKLVLHLN